MVFSVAMPMKNDEVEVGLVREQMRDVDRTLLRENLKLTPVQRLEKFAKFMRFTSELRRAGAAARKIEAKAVER